LEKPPPAAALAARLRQEAGGGMAYGTLTYARDGRVARITLNRPARLNAISAAMPGEIAAAVGEANRDDRVHVIVLAGAGRAFCAGYDLKDFAESKTKLIQEAMPWDPMRDYAVMKGYTENFMALFRSYKPTICKVHGYAVAGGSDIALCCDLVVMAETARIGYPPARVWGCPTTAMWVYRLGAERAKRMLLTGDLVGGREAKAMGLVADAVPAKKLDAAVERLAARIASVPKNQLMMQKLMINQALTNMGLETTQMLATVFDGITRHSPEGMAFKRRAEAVGFKRAVKERDSGRPLDEIWDIRPRR
jgi:enoyl-CoA hydratase